VGVNTGFDATAGAAVGAAEALPAEYFEPEASATFWIMPSGVRSRSDRAVTWTWYPCEMLVYATKNSRMHIRVISWTLLLDGW
jgi:hypothetical protein